jgi:NTE family protein
LILPGSPVIVIIVAGARPRQEFTAQLAHPQAVTTKRALILAGSGRAGIAWETGILRGIADESPAIARALLDSDVLVVTSAGSTVAAQISGPLALEQLYERQLAETSHELDPGVDIETITELFLTAMSQPGPTVREKLQRIGAVAVRTRTVRRRVIEHRLPRHSWPDRDLRTTAIDVVTGELVVFDSSSGVELVDAVAASCAVPGTWPPVTIGERRYMDGGVGSSVNTDVAIRRGRRRRDRGLRCAHLRRVRRRGVAARVRAQPAGSALPRAVRRRRARAGPAGRRRGQGVSDLRVSSAWAASSCPRSMTSAARWKSRLRHAVRGTSISRSGG